MPSHETNGERLARTIDDTDPSVILVDYLGTLVTRSISGEQIERVSSRFLRERFHLEATVDEIHRCRLDVEAIRRGDARASGEDPEYRLDDLADDMWTRIAEADRDGRPIDRTTFRDAAIEIELSIERAAQSPDGDIIEVLRSVAGRRRLVLVCDFHIPTPWFDQMMADHGIGDLFEHVFVSGDLGLSTASGRIYDHVFDAILSEDERAAIDAGSASVLRVGNHPVSRGARAAEFGLSTCPIHRPPIAGPGRLQRHWNRSHLARRRALRQIVKGQPEGFGELAVTLFAFTRSLHEQATSDGADRLVFLAREGRILRALFREYGATSPAVAGRRIDTEYLMVSRRSTYLPALRPLDEEDFSRLAALYPNLTSADLLANLGLESDQQRVVLAEMSASGDDEFDLDGLRRSDTFRQLYRAGRDEQRDLLRRLIDQMIGESGPLHVVDVGWKGTMQDHLQHIVGSTRSITGYYLGIVPGRHMLDEGTKFGLLFDGRTISTPAQRTLRHFKSIYEFLLQADHGSARRYIERDGTVRAELDDQDLEAEVYAEHIGPVQRQLEELFHQICLADSVSEVAIIGTLDDVARMHARMLHFPTRREVERIQAIRHYENFGPLGFVGTAGDDSPGARAKLRRATSIVRHPASLVGRGWPPLALASAGLSPLIPVVGTYRWLRARFTALEAILVHR